MGQNSVRNNGIIYLRVLATLFIVACHLANMSSIALLRFSAQFLNVGVEIFIIISGFLYGQKNIKKPFITWFLVRMQKILIPMYLLLIFVIVGNIVMGQSLELLNCLGYLVNMQGFFCRYISGASHLWYLSIAMVCYIITPLLQKYKEKIENYTFLFIIFAIIVQIITADFGGGIYAGYMILIMLYIVAYILGSRWNTISISVKTMVTGIFAISISVFVRLVGRVLCDGTVLYDVFIARYCHFLLAFGIFFFSAYIYKMIETRPVPKFVEWIDRYSYEIYLVHYMFCTGPFYLGIYNDIMINWMLIIIASVFSAILLKILSNWMFRLIG